MKKEFPKLFSPYGKTKTEVFSQRLGQDPKSILERISEDCAQPDTRQNAVDPEALEKFKPHIEAALKLYEQGEFKKLAWLMFGLGRQTTLLDFWPLMREGQIHVEGYHYNLDKRPKIKWNQTLQTAVNAIADHIERADGKCTREKLEDYFREDRWDSDRLIQDIEILPLTDTEKRALGEKKHFKISGDEVDWKYYSIVSLKPYYARYRKQLKK